MNDYVLVGLALWVVMLLSTFTTLPSNNMKEIRKEVLWYITLACGIGVSLTMIILIITKSLS